MAFVFDFGNDDDFEKKFKIMCIEKGTNLKDEFITMAKERLNEWKGDQR